MHYLAYVLIPGEGDVDGLVAEAMAPYDESREVEQRTETYDGEAETYWVNPVGFWDWYQIGGRWTGRLSGYDPLSDPALLEVCRWCDGTGQRNDGVGRASRAKDPAYTCNGCDGKGKRPLWPTERPRHSGDITDAWTVIANLTKDQIPHSFIVHGSESVTHTERYVPDAPDGDRFVDESDQLVSAMIAVAAARREAGYVRDRLVVVDYHS